MSHAPCLTHHVSLSTVYSHVTTDLLNRYEFIKVIVQYYSSINWPTSWWCLHKQAFYDVENHAKQKYTLCELNLKFLIIKLRATSMFFKTKAFIMIMKLRISFWNAARSLAEVKAEYKWGFPDKADWRWPENIQSFFFCEFITLPCVWFI